MLVLTRKAGEKVLIGKHIRVQVVEVKGNRIRLGIEAPAGLTILREELVCEWTAPACGLAFAPSRENDNAQLQ
jgi:carbon storage regulator CsrA